MAAEIEIRFGGDLQRIEFRPGDRFVLHVDRPCSATHAEAILAAWKDFAGPTPPPLLIVDGGSRLDRFPAAEATEAT